MMNTNTKTENYKLETKFHDDYVVHATYKWNLSTREWTDSIWKKRKRIGEGSFGDVWLEEGEGERGNLRAVKRLRRTSAGVDVTRELQALMKLKEASSQYICVSRLY